MTPKAMISEDEIIRLIAARTGHKADGLIKGIGDDAAVFEPGGLAWCVTTDLMVEGVHFSLDYFSPSDLGHRLMAANLSDLAAMGAGPRYGFLSLGFPGSTDETFINGLSLGLADLAARHGLVLAGGDTVRSDKVVLNLCLMGQAPVKGPALRENARPGQALLVTGFLGGSAAGLAWLASGGDAQDQAVRKAVLDHLRPEPRVSAGMALAGSGLIGAMMDLSDGPAVDLPRLCKASGVSAVLETGAMPIHRASKEAARRLEKQALDWALYGGEDFELVFTCEQGDIPELAAILERAEPGLGLTRIGEIREGSGVLARDESGREAPLENRGFDHF